MAEHLTMNTVLHDAFRRDIARFQGALSAFPPSSQTRADQLKTAWDFLENELHHHHVDEEKYFWPALLEAAGDLPVVAELDKEHDAMRKALAGASKAMAVLQAQASAASATAARSAVDNLAEVLFAHLEHEERDLEPTLAAYMTSKPLKKASSKQVLVGHRGRLGVLLAWLQDGADEAALRRIRIEVPSLVLSLVVSTTGRRYRRNIAPVWQ